MTRGRLGVAVRNARIAAVVIGVVVLMLPALGLAASEGGEGAGLIEINRSLLIQLLNFLLLLLVLYRFLYRPLVAALDGRSAAIKQQLAEAEAAREEAKRQLAELEGRLRAAQAEAQATRERVLREAAELRERLTAEARQEAARLVETAQTEIAHATRQARTELRAEVGALAIEVAEHLIRRSLRDEDHQRLVREAVARIGAA
jgi:F-type H+-transporting ATPase subunit b